jgi:hypothetical protein
VLAEPLERINFQRERGIVAFERDDGAQRPQFIVGHDLLAGCIVGVESRLDFVDPSASVARSIFDRSDSWVAAPPPVKVLTGGAISDK